MNEKIREKPDPHGRTAIDFDNKVPAEREKQVGGVVGGEGGGFPRDTFFHYVGVDFRRSNSSFPTRRRA